MECKSAKREYTTLSGQYLRTVMRDYQSGYTVFKILTKTNGIVTCTGNIVLPTPDMRVQVTGYWNETKSYGFQLADCTVEEVYTDKAGMVEYLCEIPGVGKSTANYLVETFGEPLYSIILSANAKATLSNSPGLSAKRVDDIIDYVKRTDEQRKLFLFIKSHGGSYSAAVKIYKVYGQMSMAKLHENPFYVGFSAGLSFHVCDSIAKETNCPSFGSMRLCAAIRHLLHQQTSCGDTFTPLCDLIKSARDFLGYSQEFDVVSSAIMNGHIADGLEGCVVENDGDTTNVYLNALYYNEVRTAYAIKRLMRSAIPTECDPLELCAYAEKSCGVTYAAQQREAFHLLCSGGIGVITGGPGTGKTTVIKGLLAAYEKLYPKRIIKLCAPSGRASQRMKETTGREATTIHRLLDYRPYGDTVTCKNEADPIEADFIIIDEGSMLSIDVADLLFSATRSGTMVLIVGDTDQLPSVGAGNVLHDIIESCVVPVIALTKTHRQAEGSLIISNAKRICEGNAHLEAGNDFEIIISDDMDIPDALEMQFKKYHKPGDAFAMQVLTPSRKQPDTGTRDINKRLQAYANPAGKGLTYSGASFRVGDKVMMMRNNYAVLNAYFNGDVGLILDVNDYGLNILIDSQVIHIDESQLDDVSLAYATTIHKSQGSEYDIAICVMPSEPAIMLQRNLLYTAITRAKQKVVLIAAPGAIEKAIFTRNVSKRKSKLMARLQGGAFIKEVQK